MFFYSAQVTKLTISSWSAAGNKLILDPKPEVTSMKVAVFVFVVAVAVAMAGAADLGHSRFNREFLPTCCSIFEGLLPENRGKYVCMHKI
jgi:hypothetical protein